ncbi:peptidase S8/S53 domain-containing protein, partial [Ilyonectria sp. MPI-CAGE-AT-0026]
LRDQGVTKILHVFVEDQKHKSHRDEAIEWCLKHTGVEVLDWNRLDIDSATITNAAAGVRDLTLHCSGNNAVLRSWLSPKGLVELENVKLTNPARREWIQCMEKSADFVRGYREDMEEEEDDPEKHPPRVKVALIDDGVDGLNADLSRIIAAGQTFSKREKHQYNSHFKHYNSYFKSTRGHGTIMAMLIRKICPNVRLYVAKLNEEKTGRNSFSITAESAVKAIWWAIEHEVHIISMSWTISQPSDAGTIQNLVKAINEAVERGILIFCSVSNQGPHDGGMYPASCNRSNSFLIGTATISGQAWRWNGANEVDYILPGTDLEVRIGDELFDSRLQNLCESGSELATALASGLAALIMDCVALNDAAELERMRDRAHMKVKMAFDSINTWYNKRDDDKYLRVWDTFGQALKDDMLHLADGYDHVCEKLLIFFLSKRGSLGQSYR